MPVIRSHSLPTDHPQGEHSVPAAAPTVAEGRLWRLAGRPGALATVNPRAWTRRRFAGVGRLPRRAANDAMQALERQGLSVVHNRIIGQTAGFNTTAVPANGA